MFIQSRSIGVGVRSSSKPARVARQADGAVFATYGETVVLATVVAAKRSQGRSDFLPLTVELPRKVPTLPAAFPAATSSAKAARPRRKRWSRA